MNYIMLYVGAALAIVWGIVHLAPTRSIVGRFGNISSDARRIVTMAWIADGVALVIIGVLVGVVAFIDPAAAVSASVFVVSAVGLFALAFVAFLTGFGVNELAFKLCPIVRVVSGVLILIGGLV